MKISSITTNTASEPSAARLSRTKRRSRCSCGCCQFVSDRLDGHGGPRVSGSSRDSASPGRPRPGVPDARRCSMKSISSSADLDLGLGRLQRDAAAVEHDEAVGDVEDVVDVVADEQDRAAARPHLAHEVEDLVGLGQRQRRRRLVEDDQVGLRCRWRARSRRPAARRPTAGRRSNAARRPSR